MKQCFVKNSIDIVFESARFFGKRLGIPAIAWIPDFQHKLLPQMFPYSAWLKREIGFRMQVAGRRTIMVSSDDAKRDCERYYPAANGHICTVHFAVSPPPIISHNQARAIADSYALPEDFFYMPNQFWRHKNHRLVVTALVMLRQRGSNVVVVASGKQIDDRSPNYFSELIQEIKQNQLEEKFRILGVIPYPHVSSLMRVCTALLNPSLVEGWSTTVEEAKTMGTPMVLSDLDVHREQMGQHAVYFNRNSPEALADALEKFVVFSQEQREQMVEKARISAFHRVHQFSEDFYNLVSAQHVPLCANVSETLPIL